MSQARTQQKNIAPTIFSESINVFLYLANLLLGLQKYLHVHQPFNQDLCAKNVAVLLHVYLNLTTKQVMTLCAKTVLLLYIFLNLLTKQVVDLCPKPIVCQNCACTGGVRALIEDEVRLR